jgi:hypothetical protein
MKRYARFEHVLSKVAAFKKGYDIDSMLEVKSTSEDNKDIAPKDYFIARGRVKVGGNMNGLVLAGEADGLDAFLWSVCSHHDDGSGWMLLGWMESMAGRVTAKEGCDFMWVREESEMNALLRSVRMYVRKCECDQG